jgi:hypothetical protein
MPAKHRSGGPPSSEHQRITSSRLVRFVDRPHGRAQNRDSFGAAARFTRQPSPTMAYPPRATTEEPGTHPEDSLAVVRSARTHLTYGEWLRRGFDGRSSMLFLENFTALDKKCPDCHQVPSISGVCGCDSAFRSQIRSQHSTQQVQQPASQGRDAGAWYPDKRGARVVARSLRSPTHRPDPDAFLPAANGVLRRMCCRSLRGLGGAFHEGLTWRGAPNGHPSFFERRIFIRSG